MVYFLVWSVPGRWTQPEQGQLLTYGMRYRGWYERVTMTTPKLTPEIVTAAILGFEAQKTRIDDQIRELRAMLSGGSTETAAATGPTKRRRSKMSAAGRARIAEAQRKRWAASRGQSESATPQRSKPKRKLSAAGKAAIVAALKKRWALKHAEAAKAQPVKKTAVKKAAKKARMARAAMKTAPAVGAGA
jgi:hypothetical protein